MVLLCTCQEFILFCLTLFALDRLPFFMYYHPNINKYMNIFKSLSEQQKVIIVTSALFLLTLSLGLLIFGDNIISIDHKIIEDVQNSVKADMLYVNPVQGGH